MTSGLHDVADVVKTGSCHAPLYAARCLSCGAQLEFRRLISAAMRDLDRHRQDWLLIAAEQRDGRRDRELHAERQSTYLSMRAEGLTLTTAAHRIGVTTTVARRWERQRTVAA